MAKKPLITAADLEAELHADPYWIALKKKRELEFEERRMKFRQEQSPIMEDLAKVGVYYRSLGEVLNSAGPYKAAIPILLEHLNGPYSVPTRETIARCLAVPDAQYAWARLKDMYYREPVAEEGSGGQVKDGLAAAVAATTPKDKIEELLAMARDRSLGSSRVLLLRRLRRSKNETVKRGLDSLANDPDLEKEIASWRKRNR